MPIFIALLAAVGLVHQQQPDRLKTILRNGATILVQPAPKDPNIHFMLFTGTRYLTKPELRWRHMLEHLVAGGKDGGLDDRLESESCFLSANTTREFMEIDLACGKERYNLGLQTIAELLQPRTWPMEWITKELAVLEEEKALEDNSLKLAAAAWGEAYGAARPDPINDLPEINPDGPKIIDQLRAKSFDPANIVLVIEGPVNMDDATADAKEMLRHLVPKEWPTEETVIALQHGTKVESDGLGEARSVLASGWGSSELGADLAAGLAIASEVSGSFMTYTPCTRGGVLSVGNPSTDWPLSRAVDSMEPGEVDGLFGRGRALAFRWLDRFAGDPYADARLRGQLLVQNGLATPKKLQQAISELTLEQFRKSVAKFSPTQAIRVVGTGAAK